MLKRRIIPCLLLSKGRLVKTRKFKSPAYIGDPINAVRIFNEKFVDEVLLLDIDASRDKEEPDFRMIRKIASECFIPLCYGGGVSTMAHARRLFQCGVEKVALNSALYENPDIVSSLSSEFGRQSIVASVDIGTNWRGAYGLRVPAGKQRPESFMSHVLKMESLGAGELLVNAVDRDGMMNGFDVELYRKICRQVKIPVLAGCGAGSLEHFRSLFGETSVSGATAGSFCVYKGSRKAVLINYPERRALDTVLGDLGFSR